MRDRIDVWAGYIRLAIIDPNAPCKISALAEALDVLWLLHKLGLELFEPVEELPARRLLKQLDRWIEVTDPRGAVLPPTEGCDWRAAHELVCAVFPRLDVKLTDATVRATIRAHPEFAS